MTTCKLISLNVNEGMRLAAQLNFFRSNNADIVCLQETTPALTRYFADELGLAHYYTTNWEKPSGDSGIAILSKINHESSREIPYWKDEIMFNERSRRVMLARTFNVHGVNFAVVNLHFIWSPNGKPSTEQQEAMYRVKEISSNIRNLILVGDFNAPRGGEVFSILAMHLTDNVPRHYTTSIDKNFHRNGEFSAMVDGIFTHKDSNIMIVNTRFESGVSDHLALITNIRIGGGDKDES